MTPKVLADAARASSHPAMEVDIKTACAGILAQKILPGARVLATGRNTEIINKEVLENKAVLYGLVHLTDDDRKKMVDMMELEPEERKRIQKELDRIATAGNEHFLQRPLMTKQIIQLIIEKKVNLEMTKNSAEVYLMLLLRNLDFHSEENQAFTELDPPENQDYLLMVLKMCQHKLQIGGGSQTTNTIFGTSSNVKGKGMCFHTRLENENVKIPVAFIKQLGIFEYRKDIGQAFLDVIHLSYLEFCCAASLCQKGLNIQQELDKIQDQARYEAVVPYLAGLFSNNASIDFLTSCKELCKNFLHLLENDSREDCLQDVFRYIITTRRGLPCLEEYGDEVISIGLSTTSGEELEMKSPCIPLLIEAMKTGEDKL